MDLAEIQHAIEELPEEQQAALAAWIAERDQAAWAAEIERDFSPGGAGLDICPTLVDLCGLKDVPTHLHGTSLRPLLKNPNAAWDRPAMTQIQRQPQRAEGPVNGYSMRTERYRYTMWDNGKEGEELYDYTTDPRELKEP